jgi:hypothetical protein
LKKRDGWGHKKKWLLFLEEAKVLIIFNLYLLFFPLLKKPMEKFYDFPQNISTAMKMADIVTKKSFSPQFDEEKYRHHLPVNFSESKKALAAI